MSSYKTAFPSKYLKAEDLGATRHLATIQAVSFQDVGTGANQERKLVATFREPGLKPLVLNMINCSSIAEAAGTDEYADWPGTRVLLFAARTEFQGKRVPCVRIDPPPANVKAIADDIDAAFPSTDAQ
jgi:hypothetical protein